MLSLSINTNNIDAMIDGFGRGHKQRLSQRLAKITWIIHQRVLDRTPVNTGLALRNYVWSTGTTAPSSVQPALGSGDPGRTNNMPLGTEPRRAINQEAADASYNRLSFANPFQRFVLSNPVGHIEGLEYGMAPLPPFAQRSPEGMFRVTFAEVAELLESKAI